MRRRAGGHSEDDASGIGRGALTLAPPPVRPGHVRSGKDQPDILAFAPGTGKPGSEWAGIADGNEIPPQPFHQHGQVKIDRMPADVVLAMGREPVVLI